MCLCVVVSVCVRMCVVVAVGGWGGGWGWGSLPRPCPPTHPLPTHLPSRKGSGGGGERLTLAAVLEAAPASASDKPVYSTVQVRECCWCGFGVWGGEERQPGALLGVRQATKRGRRGGGGGAGGCTRRACPWCVRIATPR